MLRKVTLVVLTLLWMPTLALAAVVEEVVEVPVRVKAMIGFKSEVAQEIKVTIFRDDQRQKAPYLVLHHGRPTSEADFAKMKRQRFSVNSRYFVSLGFVVLVPTRIGYGVSGGPDVEYSGSCDGRNYNPAFMAAADQTIAALAFAQSLPYVDLTRGIVVGQSFGGMTAIALSTRDLPGLAGAVNFAGGAGGDPQRSSGHPCSEWNLKSLYSEYGAAARVPTLWLYSQNDRFWGAELPRDWFDVFVKAGGKGRFVQLPPYKDNGHGMFTADPQSWRPAFEEFLREVGF